MLLSWVAVVVNFKNLEESLLWPIHCLLSFLYSKARVGGTGDLACFLEAAEGREH